MLVSAKLNQVTPLPKRPGENPNADAAAGLQSGLQGAMMQALQSNVQTQTAQASEQVQASATQLATQQVSQASKISDNVDEAFAKTRVNLQATTASVPADTQNKVGSGSATDEFKDYEQNA
jgi:Leucine-rich repeat (LRR) protein